MIMLPEEIKFAILALSGGLSFLMVCTGVSYIIQVCKTSSYYRYDSADFLDGEDDTPGQTE